MSIEVAIVVKKGSLIKYERDNEGLRERLDKPYRKIWKAAKFRLPSGKPKNEIFPVDWSDEDIMAAVKKKYSNFRELFTPSNPINNIINQ